MVAVPLRGIHALGRRNGSRRLANRASNLVHVLQPAAWRRITGTTQANSQVMLRISTTNTCDWQQVHGWRPGMVGINGRPIEANDGSRDADGDPGNWLQLPTASHDVHHRVRVIGDHQEPDYDRQAVRGRKPWDVS
jgi:hypothetical protein